VPEGRLRSNKARISKTVNVVLGLVLFSTSVFRFGEPRGTPTSRGADPERPGSHICLPQIHEHPY
jgi:hypothetical protein